MPCALSPPSAFYQLSRRLLRACDPGHSISQLQGALKVMRVTSQLRSWSGSDLAIAPQFTRCSLGKHFSASATVMGSQVQKAKGSNTRAHKTDMAHSDRHCWTTRLRALLWVWGRSQPVLAVRGAGQLGVGRAEGPSTGPRREGQGPATMHGGKPGCESGAGGARLRQAPEGRVGLDSLGTQGTRRRALGRGGMG